MTDDGRRLKLDDMVSIREIREHLINLLDSRSGNALSEFEEWLGVASWNMHRDSEIDAQSLAASIQLYLAEFDNGNLEEASLYNKLADLLTEYAPQLSGAKAS